jgi:hypothetical protein
MTRLEDAVRDLQERMAVALSSSTQAAGDQRGEASP